MQLRIFTARNIDQSPHFGKLSAETRRAIRVVGSVLPFRTNNYVLDELISWDEMPQDPIFRLTFPDCSMLSPSALSLAEYACGLSVTEAEAIRRGIRSRLNPDPSNQVLLNRPIYGDVIMEGIQHKYRQTVLLFPAFAQTCHAFCTYCFRWPQFVDAGVPRFATATEAGHWAYIREHEEISDVVLTGGDPLIASAGKLRAFVMPLLGDSLRHVRNVRFGSKALSYWPYRFLSDGDTDDLLVLFRELSESGRHVTLMAHVSHVAELRTAAVEEAIGRLRGLGVTIRTQAPIMCGINDTGDAWANIWRRTIELGCIPYYMFVARDTGAYEHFRVPLAKSLEVFRAAQMRLSGLARTARGPVMSTGEGKLQLLGTMTDGQGKAFVLQWHQAREERRVGELFLADYDPDAYWYTDLRMRGPANVDGALLPALI